MNSHPKNKSKFISFQWKEDTFCPKSICLLHYNWYNYQRQNQNLQLVLLVHVQIEYISSHQQNDLWNHEHFLQQKSSESSVEAWRVWSHFIQCQALDLLMVRYVKLWFFWYSWIFHWPSNQNIIMRQK